MIRDAFPFRRDLKAPLERSFFAAAAFLMALARLPAKARWSSQATRL